ncbi:hypothetical protein CASFOL_014477 [Castilleja foliolosa]|uniref:Uncharacterized protein n=1 Tax=Castilleja foliolosa TaxID=1961234 RepID=A0ABD3DNK3_9LAMI
MENVLRLLIFPLIFPSLRTEVVKLFIPEQSLGVITSLNLLILCIVKIKDLANIVVATLLCCPETFTWNYDDKLNGIMLGHGSLDAANQSAYENNHSLESDAGRLQVIIPTSDSSPDHPQGGVLGHDCGGTQISPRDALLSFVTSGDNVQVPGSLIVLATLLQTKVSNTNFSKSCPTVNLTSRGDRITPHPDEKG